MSEVLWLFGTYIKLKTSNLVVLHIKLEVVKLPINNIVQLKSKIHSIAGVKWKSSKYTQFFLLICQDCTFTKTKKDLRWSLICKRNKIHFSSYFCVYSLFIAHNVVLFFPFIFIVLCRYNMRFLEMIFAHVLSSLPCSGVAQWSSFLGETCHYPKKNNFQTLNENKIKLHRIQKLLKNRKFQTYLSPHICLI